MAAIFLQAIIITEINSILSRNERVPWYNISEIRKINRNAQIVK